MALGDIFNPILAVIQRALGPFGRLFGLVKNFFTSIGTAVSKSKATGALIYGEIQAWKQFQEAIPYRTGVVNIPAAVDATRDLLDEVINGWHSVVDLVAASREALAQSGGGSAAEEAEQAIADIEESGLKGLLTKFPGLAKAGEKLIGAIGLVLDLINVFERFVDDLNGIVVAAKDIREEVESASTIFLQQKNPRKKVKLAEGGSINIRLGSLHS